MNAGVPALRATNLRVELRKGAAIIEDVDLVLQPGEILGLVGESGSGKTTLALSLFGYQGRGLRMVSGEVAIHGEVLATEEQFREARGRLVSYVPQNPATALNPSMRVAEVIEDMIRTHRTRAASSEFGTAQQDLERVGVPGDREFARRFPHQLSGGQQQRVCIAASLAAGPAVVVLDEPTTGLDVVTQDLILKELVRLRDEQQVAMLYITHDLAVVSQIAGRIAVMYAGRIVEQGPADTILRRPRHPYTRGLMTSTPDHLRPRLLEPMGGIAVGVGERPAGCAFRPRCAQRVDRCESEVPQLVATSDHLTRCFQWERTPPVHSKPPEGGATTTPIIGRVNAILEVDRLFAEHRTRRGRVVAASDVSFSVDQGSCVALVGESGSGKTTIARAIVGLHPISGGRVLLDGEVLPSEVRRRTVEQRRRVQIVFQDPASTLNPRHTVANSIARPMEILRGLSKRAARTEAASLLNAVRLPSGTGLRYPRELSGGERQRVAIARALAADPDVLVCDEVTSALDVSVQAVVLDLLQDLRASLGVAIVFITHDLGVVATAAQRVLVLENGRLCEEGSVSEVLTTPRQPYTKRLLDAAPSLSAAVEAWDVADGDDAAVPSAWTGPTMLRGVTCGHPRIVDT